jgi:hypothetical protein
LPIVIAPPPPQLEEAPIAERSRPRPEATPSEAPSPPPPQVVRPASRQRAAPRATPPLESGEPITRVPAPSIVDREAPSLGPGTRAGRGSSSEAAQQSEGDFLLKQIMPHWLLDSRNQRFRSVVLGGIFQLNADGTLAAPYGKHDPWAPEVMIQNYGQMQRPELQDVRLALESFLRAARAAQPFRLPPGVTGGYPRSVKIVFKLGDL